MQATLPNARAIAPYALEAFWATGRWDSLEEFLASVDHSQRFDNFNSGVAEILRRLRTRRQGEFLEGLQLMRDHLTSAMTFSATASLHSAHDLMLQCHILTELEMIAGVNQYAAAEATDLVKTLDRRLEVLGAYVGDKQYLLGVRRAAMGIVA